MTSCPAVPAVTAHEQMSVFPRRRRTAVVFSPQTLHTLTHILHLQQASFKTPVSSRKQSPPLSNINIFMLECCGAHPHT